MSDPLHISYEELTVCEGTKYQMTLSKGFLHLNNALKNLDEIKELFEFKYEIYSAMEETDDIDLLKIFADMITQNEFKIQLAFNFKADKGFHRFWEIPKCNCPSMDNQERWGCDVGYYVNGSCPIHNEIERSNKETI